MFRRVVEGALVGGGPQVAREGFLEEVAFTGRSRSLGREELVQRPWGDTDLVLEQQSRFPPKY